MSNSKTEHTGSTALLAADTNHKPKLQNDNMPAQLEAEFEGWMSKEEVERKKGEQISILIQLRDAFDIKEEGWLDIERHQDVTACRTVRTSRWNKASSELIVRVDLYDFDLRGGPIPFSMGGLCQLEKVDFSFNHITGNIPEQFGQLRNLQELKLGENSLRGALPLSIFSLNNLRQLELQCNNFSGTLPQDVGKLTCLRRLWLDRNNFTGPVPWKGLVELVGLEELDLSSNGFDPGCLPFCAGFRYGEEEAQQLPGHDNGDDDDQQERPKMEAGEAAENNGDVKAGDDEDREWACDISRLQKLTKLRLSSMNLVLKHTPTPIPPSSPCATAVEMHV